MRLRELDMLQAIADKPSTKIVFYPLDMTGGGLNSVVAGTALNQVEKKD
jgi:hypothetical protein